MDKKQTRTSRFLSLVLRHKPEAAGIKLDAEGWVDVKTLLKGCEKHGHAISPEELAFIVENNDKKRFVVEGHRIRAAQGHSIAVELNYKPTEPPEYLYHGSTTRYVASIRDKGIIRGSRQHVHLSPDISTAIKVGLRHGYPVVFCISAKRMHGEGYKFYCAPNDVWLTDSVPAKYLIVVGNP
jgi:putative RNA 2'-phosphotransferase